MTKLKKIKFQGTWFLGWAKREGLLWMNSHCLYNGVRELRLILEFFDPTQWIKWLLADLFGCLASKLMYRLVPFFIKRKSRGSCTSGEQAEERIKLLSIHCKRKFKISLRNSFTSPNQNRLVISTEKSAKQTLRSLVWS